VRIGLLTGGGDCSGLNAAIRAIVRVATSHGDEIIAFHRGWRGVVEGDASPLSLQDTKGILQSGGTILGTARFHPDRHEGGIDAIKSSVVEERIDALIVLGGNGTLGSAMHLSEAGVAIVGIPKSIDNDVAGTNQCIGFDTAVTTAAEAIDRIHTTGESHDRLMVVEVMGRATGWLAICSGIAAGADAICIPEEPTDLDELARAIHRRHDSGPSSSIVVVAEGAYSKRGRAELGASSGEAVATALSERTGYETRLTVLGHIQRGGTPTATDKLLATRCGVAAIEAVRSKAFGTMVALGDGAIELVPLSEVANSPRPVPQALLDVAHQLTVS
jgi:6-phosphofructokinase 1